MTKLISGRVKKTPSANVSASRYEFIRLSETEPDLGVPSANGYILTANVDGTRRWIALNINESTSAQTANTAGFATLAGTANIALRANVATLADRANVATLADTANTALSTNFANASTTANIALRANVATLADTANIALFTTSSTTSNTALRANVATQADSANTALFAANSTTANTVLSISNFTTSNLAEGTNLYYTNARVYSNVIAALSSYSGNINVGNLIANTIITGPGIGGFITGANLISANNISATNWLNLYTANVIETSGSLYYTNARVESYVNPKLTTANVVESTNNLYYTNSRVYSNVITALPTYSGNIGAGNVTIGSGAGGSLIGANLISAVNIAATNWIGLYSANVIESPNALYYTNARVYANVSPLLDLKANIADLTTSNVIEGSNLYYTTARANAAITLLVDKAYVDSLSVNANTLGGISSAAFALDTDLTTANVAELNNLYYTNSRVVSAVTPLLTTANVVELNDLYYTNSRVYSNITAALPTYTGNISAAYVSATKYFGDGSSLSGVAATAFSGNTDGIVEGTSNLFYTNGRVRSAISLNTSDSSVLSYNSANGNFAFNLSAANTNSIAEGTNLYYTNSRVRSAVSGGTGVAVDSLLGTISIGQDVSTTSNVTFGALNVTGPVNFYSNITTHSSNNLSVSDNMIYLNNGSQSSNPDLGISFNYNDGTYRHAGFFRDASDGTFKVFDNYGPEPDANIFIDTDHATFRLANLSATTLFGNVQGTVSTLNNFTTSNLTEGTNKYFSNALARAAFSAGDSSIIYDPATGTIRATANITATIETTVNNLSTANVTEAAGNLYYTNARVYSNVLALLPTLQGDNITISANGRISANASSTVFATSVTGLNTANVAESASNLYYTNTRVYSNTLALLPTLAGDNITIAANGRISANTSAILGSITSLTGNIALTGNLIATNGIFATTGAFTGNVAAGNIVTAGGQGGSITGANLLSANNVSATNWIGLYTANVIETSGNLYFTIPRVVSVVNPYLTTANVIESSNNLYYTNARVESYVNPKLTTANVIESSNNLYYTNARVLSNVTAYLAANPQTSTYGNANVGAYLTTYTGNVNAGNVIANSFISTAPGTGTLTATGDFNIVSGGNIRLTGNVYANTFISTATGAGSLTSTTDFNLIAAGNISLNAPNVLANGTIVANRITANLWSGIHTANVIESASNLYFTNARVQSNVVGFLPSLAGDNITIAANGRISATLNVSSIVGLTTANVAESNNNLYYTNARVLSNVTAYLAANPAISTYGNANVGAYLTTYTGNINAGNIFANAFIAGQGLGGSITGANLISANNISASVITANTIIGGGSGGSVTGANLISTNNISSLNWIGLYTANVIESGNSIFYTNARVESYVNPKLTTANVIESSNNIYYTNARVLSNVTAYLAANPQGGSYGNANVGAYLTTYTGNIAAGNLILTGGIIDTVGVLTISTTGNSNIELVANGTGRILLDGQAWPHTDGVNGYVLQTNGTGNLFWSAPAAPFGNANVGAYLTTYTGNINAGNITANAIVAGTGLGGSITGANLISANNISASVITANTIIGAGTGGSITGANLISTNNISSVNWIGLYTANVIESGNSIFYTNARVLSNVTAYLAANPIPTSYGNANVGAYLTTYTGNISAGNVIANTIITGTGSGGSFTGANLISAGNIFATTWLNLYTANVIETSSNLYFTNARVVSALAAGSGIAISANGQISSTTTLTATSVTGLNTANVNEFGSNLYYTNARVLSNVTAYLAANPVISTYGNANVGAYLTTYTGNISAGNVIANSFVSTAAGTGTLTATGDFNIVSGGNIRLTGNIFANTFISTATGTGSITSTSDFNINAASNVNITAANINLNSNNIRTSGNITASKFFGDGSSLTGVGASSFTGNTNGITEGTNNLYYTNTRVYSNVIALLPTLAGNNIIIEANGRISANVSSTVFATAIIGLTTANVTEVGSNLYFTNTRVVSALSAGDGITLAANGRISGGVHAITDSQTFAGGNANITLATSVSEAKRIIVTIDGLVQIPITDYTVSGTILTLIPTPSPNSTIEVKFFGNEAITTQTFNPFLLAGL